MAPQPPPPRHPPRQQHDGGSSSRQLPATVSGRDAQAAIAEAVATVTATNGTTFLAWSPTTTVAVCRDTKLAGGAGISPQWVQSCARWHHRARQWEQACDQAGTLADAVAAHGGDTAADDDHLLAVSRRVYAHCVKIKRDQCVIFRGNELAGKARLADLWMRHLVHQCTGYDLCTSISPPSTAQRSDLHFRYLAAECVLKAFGMFIDSDGDESATLRQAYVRHIEVKFEYDQADQRTDARWLGHSYVGPLFLDASRIAVDPGGQSRAFQVFYDFTEGASDQERRSLGLSIGRQKQNTAPQSFPHLLTDKAAARLGLRQRNVIRRKLLRSALSESDAIAQADATSRFADLTRSLKLVGLSAPKIEQVYQLLAAILHLSTVQFHASSYTHRRQNSGLVASDPAVVRHVETLLGLLPPGQELDSGHLPRWLNYNNNNINGGASSPLMQLLTQRTITGDGDVNCTTFLDVAHATRARDKLARTLYTLLFSFIVDRINAGLILDECDKSTMAECVISVVDFPGFVSTGVPGNFMQFMWNMAEEKLQWVTSATSSTKFSNGPVDLLNSVVVMEDCSMEQITAIERRLHKSMHLQSNVVATTRQSTPDAVTTSQHMKRSAGRGDAETLPFTVRHYFGDVAYELADNGFVTDNQSHAAVDMDIWHTFSETNTANDFVRDLFQQFTQVTKFLPVSHVPVRAEFVHHRPQGASNNVPSRRLSSMLETVDSLKNKLANDTHIIFVCKGTSESLTREFLNSQPPPSYVGGLSRTVRFRTKLFLRRFSLKNISNDMDLHSLCHSYGLVADQDYRQLAGDQIAVSERCWQFLEQKIKTQTVATFKPYAIRVDRQHAVGTSSHNIDRISKTASTLGDLSTASNRTAGSTQSLVSKESEHKAWIASHEEYKDDTELSLQRRIWMFLVKLLTWPIPDAAIIWFSPRMKRAAVRGAFREKIALWSLILLANFAAFALLSLFQYVWCPQLLANYYRTEEIPLLTNKNLVVRYDTIWDVAGTSIGAAKNWHGADVSLYPRSDHLSFRQCTGLSNSRVEYLRSVQFLDVQSPVPKELESFYGNSSVLQHKFGSLAMNVQELAGYAVRGVATYRSMLPRLWIAVDETMYNMTEYFSGAYAPFFSNGTETFILANMGSQVSRADFRAGTESGAIECLDSLYSGATMDRRNDPMCVLATNGATALMFFVLLCTFIKFAISVRIAGVARESAAKNLDNYVIMFVSCYTENMESIAKTVTSLCRSDYEDKKKLLLIVCDGMVVGRGNEKSTPELVLELLGVDFSIKVDAIPCLSLGLEEKDTNMAKVYTGSYVIYDETLGVNRVVPFIVVVKVGLPQERNSPGNRGKRDSQIMLMQFLNKVYHGYALSPLELELYYAMDCQHGVSPKLYEYIMMVDADTEVQPDALGQLINYMTIHPKSLGVCGETCVENSTESLASASQVFEYFISNSLSKAFESFFGNVTCMPGCFTLWRVWDTERGLPLLISPDVIYDYGRVNVTTLHEKNMFLLGEDRYLTTILLKYFPGMTTNYNPDAVCHTIVPPTFSVLLSQRRRWINSNAHNLFELLLIKNLCGYGWLGMRLFVFMDLLGTVLLPGSVLLLAYVCYHWAVSVAPSVFTLTLVIFFIAIEMTMAVLLGRPQMLLYMIVNHICYPFYNFICPVVAFWQFDNFQWGNTRITADAKAIKREGRKNVGDKAEIQTLSSANIKMRRWDGNRIDEWRRNKYEASPDGDATTTITSVTMTTSSSSRTLFPSNIPNSTTTLPPAPPPTVARKPARQRKPTERDEIKAIDTVNISSSGGGYDIGDGRPTMAPTTARLQDDDYSSPLASPLPKVLTKPAEFRKFN